MRLSGQKPDFRELMKPEYVGSPKGSSLAELKRAAQDHGLYAVPLGKLTSRAIRACPHLVIVHVKSDLASTEYDHYELFLGTDGLQAKLLNPPAQIRLVPFPELAALWDGKGLIISSTPIDLGKVLAPAREWFVLWTMAAVIVVLLIRRARRLLPTDLLQSRPWFLGLSVVQGTGLGVVTLTCGLLYHFVCDEGLLANAKASEAIQQAHAAAISQQPAPQGRSRSCMTSRVI